MLSRCCRSGLPRNFTSKTTKTILNASNTLHNKVLSTKFIQNDQDSTNKSTKLGLSNKRAISTLQAQLEKNAKTTPLMSKEETINFLKVFPDIILDLTNAEKLTDVRDVTEWYAKVLQYNVPTGKKIRSFALISSYKMLEKPENLTPDNIKKAYMLGWCIEMVQAYTLIIDDIMDASETRRGFLCWYKNKEIGLQAINDALLIKGGVFSILRKYFSHLPCYIPILEQIHDIDFKTSIGQSLDCKTYKNGRPDLDNFTIDKYNTIVKYKAGYSMLNSVRIAMFLAGIYDCELHKQASDILLEISIVFQAQNDFLDAFGNVKVSKKIGSDIKEGKCSFLVVLALQKASSVQKDILRQHYGVKSPDSEQTVKDLYIDLSIPQIFIKYEEETYNIIKRQIQKITKGLPQEMFLKIIDQVYPKNN